MRWQEIVGPLLLCLVLSLVVAIINHTWHRKPSLRSRLARRRQQESK